MTEIRKDSLGGMWLKNVHGETIGKYPADPHSIIADLPKSLTAPIKLRKVTAQYRDGDHVWIGGDEKLTIIDLSREDLAKLSDCRTIRFRSIILDGDSVLWGGYGHMPGNAVYAIVKKAAPDAMIQFTATESDSQYILKIRDNGIGIDQDILNKVFDPFFTTKTTGEGSGVGLYLSREIIQNHGGDISVTSAMDEFTEFTITLPTLQ